MWSIQQPLDISSHTVDNQSNSLDTTADSLERQTDFLGTHADILNSQVDTIVGHKMAKLSPKKYQKLKPTGRRLRVVSKTFG